MLFICIACVCADPQSQFLSDYPAQIGQLKRGFADFRGVATVRMVKGAKPTLPGSFEFSTGLRRRKFEFERTVRLSPGKLSLNRYVYAELDGRIIELQRTGSSEPFIIRGMGDDDPMRLTAFNAVFGKYLNCPWEFGGYDIGDAFSRGWLVITGASEIELQGHKLVEMTFRQTTSPKPNYFRAAFDPSIHWAIIRASTWETDQSNPEEHYEAAYGSMVSGQIYMKSLHWWEPGGKERLIDFGPVEFASTPASEFTLEHYGLKSPPRPERGPGNGKMLIILSLAVVLLSAAWFMRRLAKCQ